MRYIQDYGGYIADVPKIWFKRCDGRVFHFDQLTDASLKPSQKQMEVSAGWSQHPVAYLPGQSTFQLDATSAKFDQSVFEMTNSTEFVENDEYAIPVSEELVIDSSNKCILTYAPIGQIQCVLKYTERSLQAENVIGSYLPYEVDSINQQIIYFDSATAGTGDIVQVTYFRHSLSYEARVSNRNPAVGEAVVAYPVYGSNKVDVDTIVIGHVFVRIYKARIIEHSQLSSQHKTATTHRFVLQAMDAKRADGANYSIAYIAKFRANVDNLNTKML